MNYTTFRTHTFSDLGYSSNIHANTRWQISINELFTWNVFDAKTGLYLTEIIIPRNILEEGITYYCKVRFYDAMNAASEWSDIHKFKVIVLMPEDNDGNGLPDEDEVDATLELDLDADGTLDTDQEDLKIVSTKIGDVQIAVKTEGDYNLEFLCPIDPAGLPCTENCPEDLPFGLISFKLTGLQLSEEVAATVYISEPLLDETAWYKYTPELGLYDYSDHTTYLDAYSAVLYLKDGGYGDSDGVKNGVIL